MQSSHFAFVDLRDRGGRILGLCDDPVGVLAAPF